MIIELTEKYGIKLEEKEYRYGYSQDWFYIHRHTFLRLLRVLYEHNKETRAALLFPGGRSMPFFVADALKKIIEPFRYVFREYEKNENDKIICRENKIRDFSSLALT